MGVVLVTGAAGFIGSHLCARLLERGDRVRAIDNFDPYYHPAIKHQNLAALQQEARFEWVEGDLNTAALEPLLTDVDCVFHLAARAGVRRSWGASFSAYVAANLTATQRLFDAVRDRSLQRLVFASSSSVYGELDRALAGGQPAGGEDAAAGVGEEAVRRPISPYGVTKLAGEGLAHAYASGYGVPIVALRYFTVYGPRQRPDMAFHRFLRAALEERPVTVYGDGGQTRDFTYVDDAVAATLAAAERGRPGGVYNVGGGSPASVLEVLATIEQLCGRPVAREHRPSQPGDPRATRARTARARADLGYAPRTGLSAGLAAMHAWMQRFLQTPAAECHDEAD